MAPPPLRPASHDDAWELEAGIVRPYLFTQGRTEPTLPSLAVETMLGVTRSGRALAPTLPTERRRIVEVCRVPKSVAEVAARLGVPLGVVRVLVADLHTEGLITIHAGYRERQGGGQPAEEIAILQRLIDHVRAIPA